MYTAASIGDKYEGELDHNEIAVDIVNNLDHTSYAATPSTPKTPVK